jgi:hypothetical protein
MRIVISTPYKEEIKTLKLKGYPGIGLKEDIEGNIWDIYNYIGADYTKNSKPIIHARLKDMCPKYSTADWDLDKSWDIKYIPYYAEFD